MEPGNSWYEPFLLEAAECSDAVEGALKYLVFFRFDAGPSQMGNNQFQKSNDQELEDRQILIKGQLEGGRLPLGFNEVPLKIMEGLRVRYQKTWTIHGVTCLRLTNTGSCEFGGRK